MPIEGRWEALEELEKVTVDRARLLSRTDKIALMRAGPLQIVRVGPAKLAEEARWRYGKELTGRKRNWDKLGVAGTVATGALVAGGWAAGGISMLGLWLILGHRSDTLGDAARWLRFGSSAWRGQQQCSSCGFKFRSVAFRDRNDLGLLLCQDSGEVEIVSRCSWCGLYRNAGLSLTGDEADRTLRRVLAYHHFAVASEKRVLHAAHLIQEAVSPQGLTRNVLRDGKRLGDLQRTDGIALEIAANEAAEQHLLELEVADLEAQWRREEELAAIIDGELTPLPVLERMRRRIAPG